MLFSAVHLDVGSLIPFALIGVTFTWVYVRSRQLASAMLAHFLFNAIAFAAVLVENGVGMSRYAAAFAAAARDGRPLCMPFLTGGFPSREETVPLIEAIVAGGAGGLELGVPFSDPIADGLTIQRASMVALEHGASVSFVLEAVRAVRERGIAIPITLMGYLNPFLAYSGGTDVERLARDSLIVVLPGESERPGRGGMGRRGRAS